MGDKMDDANNSVNSMNALLNDPHEPEGTLHENNEVDKRTKDEQGKDVGKNNTAKQDKGDNDTRITKNDNQNTKKTKEDDEIIPLEEDNHIVKGDGDTDETDKSGKGTKGKVVSFFVGIKDSITTAFKTGKGRKTSQVSDNVTASDVAVDVEHVDKSNSKLQSKDKKEREKERKRIEDEEKGIFPVTKEDLDRKKNKVKDDEDEVDAVSIWSYFMAKKNFQYYFQHPYFRLFIAYFVTLCNFLIYAEDPVAHSMKECTIPMIGNNFAFVLTRYPANGWSVLKVFMWLLAIVIGIIVGKLLIHGLFFNRLCRLRMFEDDMGSFMVSFLTVLVVMFIFSLIYDLFLMIGGSATDDIRISSLMGISNSLFMKMAACGTWCGDFFTAWMVTDMMLQEKLYPHWAVSARRWWTTGYRRIILFWTITTVASFIVVFVIATDYIQWDKLNRDFLHSNEVSRAFLASFILVMDILIVLQDWDFPHFVSAIDIKLPGVNTARIQIDIPKCLKREEWQIHITGKWFNYGILFLVMILDLNMWKNQIFYAPYDYGQYTNPDGKIYSVMDDYSLQNFNESMLTYSYRSTTIDSSTNQTYLSSDTFMNAHYNGYHLAIKLIAFIPAVAAFITFGVLLWKFGRRVPSEQDVYAGRLKKRKRDANQPKFGKFATIANMMRVFKPRKKVKDNNAANLVSFQLKDQNVTEVPSE